MDISSHEAYFALQIVLDLWRVTSGGSIYNNKEQYFPFDKVQASSIVPSHPKKDDSDRLLDLAHGKKNSSPISEKVCFGKV